jgi:RimJ/RimL family protein N-acetyltransferase
VNIESNALDQPVGPSLPQWQPPSPPATQTMQGCYCRLEALDPTLHTKQLYTAFSANADGGNWTYLGYGPFSDIKEFRRWMEQSSGGNDPLFFAVMADDQAVGVASYLNIAPANGSVEVGHIHFSEALKRTPAATEAMYLMMRRAFEQGYRRYEWKCDALNAPSRRAAQRFGFSYEGIFRQAVVYKGRSRDTAWFAAIDAEWPSLQRAFETWLDPENFSEDGKQRLRLADLTQPILKAPSP